MPSIIKNTPIGLSLPITNGNNGYFDQTMDTFTQYKMNITNLIRTRVGERRMSQFGSRLWNELFEPNDSLIPTKVSSLIKSDVARWVPGITVNSVQVNQIDNGGTNIVDSNILYIEIDFTVDSINQSDVIKIMLNAGIVI